MAEIQQNSDTTFRVYDWIGQTIRQGPGTHVEQALETIDFSEHALDRDYQFARCAEHFHLRCLTSRNITG